MLLLYSQGAKLNTESRKVREEKEKGKEKELQGEMISSFGTVDRVGAAVRGDFTAD